MARTWVKVEGLRELERALAELPKRTSKSVARRTLLKAAQPMAEDARSKAPDDPATGGKDLHTSISAGTKLSRGGRRRHRKQSDVEVFIGPHARHAHLQEFGTAHHAAQPFMRPAWDAGKMKALDTIKEELWNEIKKAAKRIARRAARAK